MNNFQYFKRKSMNLNNKYNKLINQEDKLLLKNKIVQNISLKQKRLKKNNNKKKK